MKKFLATLSLALVVTLSAVGFAACKKTSIVGTWKFSSVSVKLVEGAEGDVDTVKENIEEYYKKYSFKFESDGTGTIFIGEETDEFNWKKDGSKVTLTDPESQENEGIELTFKDGKLYLEITEEGEGTLKVYFKK